MAYLPLASCLGICGYTLVNNINHTTNSATAVKQGGWSS